MRLWTLVVGLAVAASLCAALALVVTLRMGFDPYLVANAAMLAVMALYATRQASRPKQAVLCRRCGATEWDPMATFCIRCGHIPRSFRPADFHQS